MSDKQQKALQQQLSKHAAKLDTAQLQSLVDFAAFLIERHAAAAPVELPEPQSIERPENESVIAAIKRLSATYPMLDKDTMLHQTSSLVAEHVMQGREAADVIDQLEEVFYHQYQKLKSEDEQK